MKRSMKSQNLPDIAAMRMTYLMYSVAWIYVRDSISADGFSIEEAHWLYMRAMEWANGDKFYIHFGHEDNIVSNGELEKVNLIVLE